MKLSICGDICPIGTNELWKKGENETLFHDVPSLFADSDRVIVNLECATTERGTPIKKFGPNLGVTSNTAYVLREIGVTDCAISNNHIFDLGEEGVRDTIEALEKAGLGYTGFGENESDARKDLIIEKDGLKVAVLAVCEHEYCYALPNRMGARAFDPYDTLEDIRNAKANNDYVVVLYHGGKEQCAYPSPRLRHQSQAMVKAGADVILCQHSHCVGCYEEFMGGHILYGQGNFHFVSRREDDPQWHAPGSTLIWFPRKSICAPVLLTSSASSALSVPSWTKLALLRCLECKTWLRFPYMCLPDFWTPVRPNLSRKPWRIPVSMTVSVR